MKRALPAILAVGLMSVLAPACSAGLAATRDDLEVIRHRMLETLLPAGADARLLVRKAREQVAAMTPDGTWADVDTAGVARSNWELRPHLDRTLLIAKASAIARRDGRPDAALAQAAVRALDYWIRHDFQNPNWWWNEIGTPQLTGEAVLLLGADCPPATRDGVVTILKRAVWTKWTGQNLVWGVTIQVKRGLIAGDPELVARAYERMYREVTVSSGEGIQADYSFHQHGPRFYSGGYGLAFAQDVGRYIAFAWGTGCQPPADVMETFGRYMLDGEAWMTWGSLFDYSALGREIVRPGKAAVSKDFTGGPVVPVGASYGLGRTVWMLSRLAVPRQTEYADWASRLLNPIGSANAVPLAGHRHFWRSDYTAHRRAGYLFSVKMFSTRVANTEFVNDEGKRSHHLGDGNTFLYRTGDEYRDIFPVWDWGRLPGTTAEQADDLDKLLPGGNRERGKTSFVGGVSDGTYGVTAMDLRRGKLSAKKSWFFFDDEIVCLGSSIDCDSDNPVVTTVEQCFAVGTVGEGLGGAWVHHNGVGYVFSGRQTVRMETRAQTGAWSDIGVGPSERITRDVFSLWIDHGAGPKGAAYAYVLLPGATPEQTASRAENSHVRVVVQSEMAHAVRHERLGITGVVFFAAGEAAGIVVDRPCVVMLRHGRLSVCDPAQGTGVVAVSVNGRAFSVELPSGPMAGSTVGIDVR